MKISDIKISLKKKVRAGELLEVGNFILEENTLKFKKHKDLTNEEYKCEFGRVYLITVDDEIYKIGGSSDKSGIKNTITSYLSGDKGSPGKNRFALNILIKKEINNGKLVKVYMIICPETFVRINGLTTTEEMVPVFAYKEIEKLCLKDYEEFEKSKPLWNFKEGGKEIPEDIKIAYNKYDQKKLKK